MKSADKKDFQCQKHQIRLKGCTISILTAHSTLINCAPHFWISCQWVAHFKVKCTPLLNQYLASWNGVPENEIFKLVRTSQSHRTWEAVSSFFWAPFTHRAIYSSPKLKKSPFKRQCPTSNLVTCLNWFLCPICFCRWSSNGTPCTTILSRYCLRLARPKWPTFWDAICPVQVL